MFLKKQVYLSIFQIYIKSIIRLLPKYIYKSHMTFPEMEMTTSSKYLLPLTNILKKHTLFKLDYLNDITAIDYINQKYRFNLKYILTSLHLNIKLNLSVFLKEYKPITSLISNYSSANWIEREVWDLFGIFFWKHPDLRKILTDYGFKGFPLRKDFPVTGFSEIFYDVKYKKIVSSPNYFYQEFRTTNDENTYIIESCTT